MPSRNKFLPLRVEPSLKGLRRPQKQTGSHETLFSLLEIVANMEIYDWPKPGDLSTHDTQTRLFAYNDPI